MKLTFEQQAETWLADIQSRRRSPIKPASAATFRSHLNNLIPKIGHIPISEINNRTLRDLVPQINAGPRTVQLRLSVVKSVVASVLNDDGEPLYPRRWNPHFIDEPLVEIVNNPGFISEQISLIIAGLDPYQATICSLAASSGLRIGEILALEVRHLAGRVLTIEQNKWGSTLGLPKSKAGLREVDLCSTAADDLRAYIGERTDGFIFDKARSYVQNLRELHARLDALKIPRTGFHAFRRYRITYLKKMGVSDNLREYWVGHSPKGLDKSYDKVAEEREFRAAEAERVGRGF